jgi:hypothetical protein
LIFLFFMMSIIERFLSTVIKFSPAVVSYAGAGDGDDDDDEDGDDGYRTRRPCHSPLKLPQQPSLPWSFARGYPRG